MKSEEVGAKAMVREDAFVTKNSKMWSSLL
jgi:hypothetical protein